MDPLQRLLHTFAADPSVSSLDIPDSSAILQAAITYMNMNQHRCLVDSEVARSILRIINRFTADLTVEARQIRDSDFQLHRLVPMIICSCEMVRLVVCHGCSEWLVLDGGAEELAMAGLRSKDDEVQMTARSSSISTFFLQKRRLWDALEGMLAALKLCWHRTGGGIQQEVELLILEVSCIP